MFTIKIKKNIKEGESMITIVGGLKKEKYFLLVLFGLSLLIRALVFNFYLSQNKNYWQVDSNTYHVIAKQIAQGKGITITDNKPNFYRVPGYSFFLSFFYRLFGVNTKNVLWAQIILAAFIPILIFLLSLTLFRRNFILARIASLYSSIHVGLVLYSGFFMTESLFLFFLLLFFIFFFSGLHVFFCTTLDSLSPSEEAEKACTAKSLDLPPFFPELTDETSAHAQFYEKAFSQELQQAYVYWLEKRCARPTKHYLQKIFLAGLCLGVAALIRPVGHYLLVISCLLLLCSRKSIKRKITKSFLLFLGWVIPVSFWLIRNYMLAGAIFFHTLPGGHFLYLSAARVAMHVHDTTYHNARKILRKEVELVTDTKEHALGRSLTEIESCNVHEKIAIKYFLKRPFITLKNWFTDMFRTSFSLYSAELLYLESGRKAINYFAKDRGIWSLFKRYLIPQTENNLLKIVIYTEIALFLFILLGFVSMLILSFVCFFKSNMTELLCVFCKVLPFMCLFIVISLSGGYARMRLPIETFLIIFAWYFWGCLFKRDCCINK